jgi:hypothetical protein
MWVSAIPCLQKEDEKASQEVDWKQLKRERDVHHPGTNEAEDVSVDSRKGSSRECPGLGGVVSWSR